MSCVLSATSSLARQRLLVPGVEIVISAETSFWDSPRMLYILKIEAVPLTDSVSILGLADKSAV